MHAPPMQIFDQVVRSDDSPSKHVEPYAEFLNRVSGQYWDQVRDCIEQWAAAFPEESRADLRSRLRDRGKDQAARSALWEIYLHAMLTGAGYEVECHPEMPDTSRKPDFLASGEGGYFYLEARVISPAEDQVAIDNRRGQIYDVLNQISNPNFYLAVGISREGKSSPRAGKMKSDLERWLNALDPVEVQTFAVERPEGLPSYKWEDGEWFITFTVLPGGPARHRPTSRAIGGYPIAVDNMDEIRPIRKALKDKGSAYGKIDAPFVVAIASYSGFTNDGDVENALYGTSRQFVSYDANRSPSYHIERHGDGYWKPESPGDRQGVSGVLVAVAPAPWNWARTVPTLWENPNPRFPAPNIRMWRRGIPRRVEVAYKAAEAMPHTVLGLSPDWPLGEAFPH
jgi:hypothetical protein